MSRIQALHLVNSFGDSSISRIIIRLVSRLQMNEVQWHVGALSGHGLASDEFMKSGATLVDFSGNGLNSRSMIERKLREYVSANEIRIIHTHTPRTIFSAALACGRDSSVTHLATKHLLTQPHDRKWGTVFTVLDRLSLYFPDWLIPVSQKMHDQITSQPGVRSRRVVRIYNAIPCEQFYAPAERASCRDELGIPANAMVLGYVGRIQKVKRIDVLLDSFRQISNVRPDTYLVIVGDGDEIDRLRSYADQLGLSDRVIWTGHRKDIPRLLAALDICVQTSVNEGFSLSILEAMAAGRPVVATDVGGNSEVIVNGVNGLLVSTGSPRPLVDAILCLMEHPEIRDQYSLAGLELVRAQFSLNSMVDGYRNLYQAVLSEIRVGRSHGINA